VPRHSVAMPWRVVYRDASGREHRPLYYVTEERARAAAAHVLQREAGRLVSARVYRAEMRSVWERNVPYSTP
jgi:hypothetical protein